MFALRLLQVFRRKTRAGEEKIDGYNTVIIARRAKSGEWQGAKKKVMSRRKNDRRKNVLRRIAAAAEPFAVYRE